MTLLQVERTYTGPQSGELVEHMKACNPRGPLVIHVAKLFPRSDVSAFDALGRILSGTVKPGGAFLHISTCFISVPVCGCLE